MLDNKAIWPGWETVKLIGRGSFGTVYEIQRKLFDDVEKSALKVISIPQNESDIEEMYNDGYDSESITSTFNSHLKNIVAEYSLMKKMSGCHNIVTCDDVRYVQHDDGIGWDIYIKMELLTPLVKVLPEKPSEELVIKLAKDICNALVYCKKYDIVHRDIKPQNIFASENGEYKLGDFGIAETVEKTMGGTKIGTYKYMAPEVYNNQPYGSAADIYSLGLVLYWLLNERRMPFMPLPPAKLKSGAEEEARNRRLSGETLPAPKNGSKALKEIVLKACAYDIENRYSSAAEMLADLEKIECGAVAQLPEVVDESFLLTLNQQEEVEPEGTVSLFTRRSEPTQRPVVEDKKVEVPASVVEPVTETAKQKETPAVKETVIPVKQPEEKEKTPVKKNGGKKGLIIGAIILIAAIIIFLLLRGCGGTNPGVSGDKSAETVSETVSDTSTEASFVPSVSDESIDESVPEDNSSEPEHTHSYSSTWKSNETAHWYECACGEKSELAEHAWSEWSTTKEATETSTGSKNRSCSYCRYSETAVIPMLSHTHSYSSTWKSNETAHWYECACGEKNGVDVHSYGAWKTITAATETKEGKQERTCIKCGYKESAAIPVLSHKHSYSTSWKSNGTSHWKECSCGEKNGVDVHSYGAWKTITAATETKEGKQERTCTKCSYKETAAIPVLEHKHSYSTSWKSNGTSHWHECSCGEKTDVVSHTYSSWKTVKPATCNEAGKAQQVCTVCDVVLKTKTLETVSHDYVNNTCSMCGKKRASWSAWTDTLPNGINESDYEIEETLYYSFSELEFTESTIYSYLPGWQLYSTVDNVGDYGAWSSWSTTYPSSSTNREMQNKTQYRYRNKSYTTSTSDWLSGWTNYDVSYDWGSYGSWSGWSTTPVYNSDSCDVQTKTQYRYRDVLITQEYSPWSSWSAYQDDYRKETDLVDVESATVYGYYYYLCPNCGAHMHVYDVCYTWAGGCGKKPIGSDGWRVVWSTTSWNDANLSEWHGTGKYSTYIDGQHVFKWTSGGTKTQYRYRTRTLDDIVTYSSWSNYEDTVYTQSSTREVQTRTMYRYRTRSQNVTYYYYKWDNWSDWSDSSVSSNSNREVDTQQVYRYRDRIETTTYYFQRWTEWSAYSATPRSGSDTVQVRTKTMYRYREK